MIVIYSYKVEKRGKWKKILLFLLAMAIVSFSSIKIYDIYLGIEVKSYGTADNVEEKNRISTSDSSDGISEVLENTTKNVVGISKIKKNGSSIFSTSTNEEQLGLGSRSNYF